MLTRMRSAGARRQLGAGLILLALWLQALAPAAGFATRARAAEAAAADALIHAVICGQDPSAALAADPAAPDRPNCDRCPFCRCTAAAPLPSEPAVVGRPVIWQVAAWPFPPPPREPRPPRSPALARAPPLTV